MLWHRYRLEDDGSIAEARIVPPTSQNQARIEQDLLEFVRPRVGAPRRSPPVGVRAGDPQLRPLHQLLDPLPEARGRQGLAGERTPMSHFSHIIHREHHPMDPAFLREERKFLDTSGRRCDVMEHHRDQLAARPRSWRGRTRRSLGIAFERRPGVGLPGVAGADRGRQPLPPRRRAPAWRSPRGCARPARPASACSRRRASRLAARGLARGGRRRWWWTGSARGRRPGPCTASRRPRAPARRALPPLDPRARGRRRGRARPRARPPAAPARRLRDRGRELRRRRGSQPGGGGHRRPAGRRAPPRAGRGRRA